MTKRTKITLKVDDDNDEDRAMIGDKTWCLNEAQAVWALDNLEITQHTTGQLISLIIFSAPQPLNPSATTNPSPGAIITRGQITRSLR